MRRSLLLLLFATACGNNGGVNPDRFFTVDFPGTWEVRSLVRTDAGNDVPVDPGTAHLPFRPLHDGAFLSFAGQSFASGHLADGFGQPLYAEWHAGVPNSRYTNLTSQSAAFFDFASQGTDGCSWREEVTVSFQAISNTELIGNAVIVSTGDCTNPAPLPAAAVGSFRFRLVQVALPAQLAPRAEAAGASEASGR